MASRISIVAAAFVLVWALVIDARTAFGVAGADSVAQPGNPMTKEAAAQFGWPAGVLELINDELRTTGWRPWFSGCPDDGTLYLYEVTSTDDVNRLIEKFSAIKEPRKRIILSLGAEPRSIPFAQNLPARNGTGAVFLVGSQKILNEWHMRLSRDTIVIQTLGDVPKPQPPSLKIYVGHEAIELEKLKIPVSIELEWGYEPTPELVEMLKWDGSPIDRLMPDVRATKEAVEKLIAAHNARRKSAGINHEPPSKRPSK